MAGKTEIFGIGGLQAKFLEMRQDMAQRTSVRITASGANALKKEAKALAQGHGFNKSGTLIRNISIKRERSVPEGVTQYNLGVRHGRDLTKKARDNSPLVYRKGRIRYANDPFYWSFLEFGWIPRGPGKALRGGINRKKAIRYIERKEKIPGRSFIAQALKNKQQEAIAAMQDRLEKDLTKYK